MSLSSLPLCYCTNVHPGRTLADVLDGLDDYTLPVARAFREPLAAGLWLAEPVVREILAASQGPQRLRDELSQRELTCHTLNAFPFGDFHSSRVKEHVYIPDWGDQRRLNYTQSCATVLAELLSDGVDGSLSTVPLAFKGFEQPPDFRDRAADNLISLAKSLARLRSETGKWIRLAVEPEPFCLLETTNETLEFFEFLFQRTDSQQAAETVRSHVGVCYDVCHQAVEFEDVAASIRQLNDAGVRINKVHITCALKADRPADDRNVAEALAQYVEPRYLHQTLGRRDDGSIVRAIDLTEDLVLRPTGAFQSADEWRVHFHVPVNAERLGPLKTTREELRRALQAVATLDYAPHLEVETYTWPVLPDGDRTDLVAGLTAEMIATRALLKEVAAD
ncbi:MAG: metabolite traffic protein EboE [Planctomycetaceae bacterium]